MKKIKIDEIARRAKDSSRKLALASTDAKNAALDLIADELIAKSGRIIAENRKDVSEARKKGLSGALIDRLVMTEKTIRDIAKGVRDIAALPDPVGEVLSEWRTPSGMRIKKVKVPLGVVGMIYESRPNVTVDSSALCLKSSNAIILRGGKEAINSNRILVRVIKDALEKSGRPSEIPQEIIQFIDDTDRRRVYEMVRQDALIDLIIPRGGEEMIKKIRREATVPVLAHGKGVCHTYIDTDASADMAIKVSYNAKVQRPGVCNAMETLLVHRDIAEKVLPQLARAYAAANVEIRGCPETLKILPHVPHVKKATKDDWPAEYLDLILSVKVVGSTQEAIEHINKYGSGHSDAIITDDEKTAGEFIKGVDSAAVFHNASTRLHDGGVFGLGAEIGISTQKLHARGTMGVRELTTTKYIVTGTGQVRE